MRSERRASWVLRVSVHCCAQPSCLWGCGEAQHHSMEHRGRGQRDRKRERGRERGQREGDRKGGKKRERESPILPSRAHYNDMTYVLLLGSPPKDLTISRQYHRLGSSHSTPEPVKPIQETNCENPYHHPSHCTSQIHILLVYLAH